MDNETGRQLFHMAVGFIAIALLYLFGRWFMIAAVFFIMMIGMALINQRKLGKEIPVIRWFEDRFEREDAPLPGWGSACYAAGVLIALTFLSSPGEIMAVIFILAVGDGVSTLAGRRIGRHGMPYNRNKTVEGTAAFFASSLLSYIFIGPAALPLALAGAIAESVPMVDDNILVPIACTAVLMIL
ncbi:MAG: hypothetical protein U0R44_07165 [Candidatus Micrarchaeia archaeon]